MRHGSIIFTGPTAIAVMIFYYLIPFLIVAGAPDSFAKLRPFVITASVLLIAFGAFKCGARNDLKFSYPGWLCSCFGFQLLRYSA